MWRLVVFRRHVQGIAGAMALQGWLSDTLQRVRVELVVLATPVSVRPFSIEIYVQAVRPSWAPGSRSK